jgi:hypothetical protein
MSPNDVATEELAVPTVEMAYLPYVPAPTLPRPDEPCLFCKMRLAAIPMRPENPERAPKPVFMQSGAIGYVHYLCAGSYRHEVSGLRDRVESILRGTSDPSA